MDVSVTVTDEKSPHLLDVTQLGDENKDTLGLLPREAYREAARQRRILVALDPDGTCVGYLLFRIAKTQSRASITHLCVQESHRNKGIGRKL